MSSLRKNNNYSQATINELFHLVKTTLIREQIDCVDQSEKLSFLYEELLNRDRLDVYDDAVSSAISQTSFIEDFKTGATVVSVRSISPDSRYEFAELLRNAFKSRKDDEKISASMQLLDILKIFGMEDSSFICDVTGKSMIDANIFEGDTLVVNRDKKVSDGDLVVVKFDNYIFVKRFIKRNGNEYFSSENIDYKPVQIDAQMDFEILGVVKSVIHKF
ncbi:MAG: S24 family peptidase [bacterium]